MHSGRRKPRCSTAPGRQYNVSLVRTPPEHSSPAHPLASLPASSVNEDVLNGSTQTELQPRAKAAATAIGPKSETNPLGATGRKRGRSRGRQRDKQKRAAGISKFEQKLSPELMRIVLDHLREYPLLSSAARKAGIHPKTLAYWLKRSEAGDDGYDVEWQGVTSRFHEHYELAIDEAHDDLLGIMFQRTQGYDKVLTYRGRVSYKIDELLVELGYQGPDAYLKDENGNPVPETVRKVDKKAMKFILKLLRRETYGNTPKIDLPQKGGVLVIGDAPVKPKHNTAKPKYNTTASVKARQWKSISRRIREEKD